MAEQVILVSNDKEGEARTFTVNRKAIELSVTVKNLLQEMPDDDGDTLGPIPLPNVSGPILEKVITYVTHYYENPDPEAEKKTEAERRSAEIPEWDKNYCSELNMEDLFNLILAANYLDIKPLLDLTCKTVANMIKGKTPDEIKALFGVTREFTAEEEEQVKRENPWLVEQK